VDRAALITGVAGQDGVHLARFLNAQGYRVIGCVAPGSDSATRLAPYLGGVEIVEVDIRDVPAMRRLVFASRPDEVYNLAALSSVGSSWDDSREVAEVNGTAVGRLLEMLLRYREECGSAPRFFQASSAEIFGVAEQQPQNEQTPLQPQSPYGFAKRMAHETTVRFRETHQLFACNGILFNHESPLRRRRFVTRKITSAAVAIAAGRRHELVLGTLDVRRDWGAASDYVRAMWQMLQEPEAGDFVVATGVATSLRTFVEIAFRAAGIDDPWPYVREDPLIARPADPAQALGDATQANRVLGWRAELPLRQLIEHMVAADRERLRRGIEESPEFLTVPT
jgi:GDPmannose 4,6-dehydratase